MTRVLARPELPDEESEKSPEAWLRGTLSRHQPMLPSAVAAGALLIGVLLWLGQEQFTGFSVGLCVLGFVALIASTGWWKRAIAYVILADIILVAGYTWSLGERSHVTIRVTPTSAVAWVDGNKRVVKLGHAGKRAHARAPRLALYWGVRNQYAVTPLGGVPFALATDPLSWLAKEMRFITPEASWSNLHMTFDNGRNVRAIQPSQLRALRGRWGINPRGEVTGSKGAVVMLPPAPARSFTVSADLMRADDPVSIVVGLHSHSHARSLNIQLDHRQAWWTRWKRLSPGSLALPVVMPPFVVSPVSMFQFLLRMLLPSVILALVLALLILVVSAGLAVAAACLAGISLPGTVSVPALGPRIRPWIADGAAVLIGIAGIIAAAWLATHAYRGLPQNQDGADYLFQAKTLALARISAPVPAIRSFFDEWSFIVYHRLWFSKYQPGWPAVLSVGVLIGKPWLVNPVVEGLGLVVLYFLGREMYGWKVGLLAAGIGLTSPFFLFVGNSFYPEATAWLFLGTYASLVVAWEKRNGRPSGTEQVSWSPGPGWLLVPAGLTLGLAVITRQLDALAFCLPFLYVFRRRPLAIAWVVAGGLLPVIAYFAYDYALLGTVLSNAYQMVDSWDRLGFGPHVGGRPGQFNSGYSFARALWNLASDVQNTQISFFGWPYLFPMAIAALPFVLGRARRSDWMLLATFAAVAVAYMAYFYQGLVQHSFPRYWYLLVPCVTLLAARGIQELYRLPQISALRLPSVPFVAFVAPTALLVVLFAFDLGLYLPALTARVTVWRSQDAAAVDAVTRAHVHNAVIFQVQNGNWWWPYGGVFPQNSPLLNGDIVWARDEGVGDQRLMRLYPGRYYYRLVDSKLTRLAPSSGPAPAGAGPVHTT